MNINIIKMLCVIPLTSLLLVSCATLSKPASPQQLTCLPEQLFRCEPDEQKCLTIPIVKELGNTKIVIDLAEREVKSYTDDKLLSHSNISSIEYENDLIYLAGKGYGYDKALRVWNAIVDLQSGRLYSTSITTGAGHVIYGKCDAKTEY
ncbi:MAG: hypothetical protein GQ582_03240 [Methyloprofundus sp.]|nr:hypothetical protein [Methyloprofundus sp.]